MKKPNRSRISELRASVEDRLEARGVARWSPQLMDIFQWPGLKQAMGNDGRTALGDAPAQLAAIFERLHLDVHYFREELKRIPKSGPFIAVANHPFGMLDALLVLHVMLQKRPDVRVVGPFRVPEESPLKHHFVTTPNKRLRKRIKFNLDAAVRPHLESEGGIIVFPAGAVSSVKIAPNTLRDTLWTSDITQLIKKAQVPAIPIAIHGSQLLLQELISRLFPGIKSRHTGDPEQMEAPTSEPLSSKKKVTIRVGKPIQPKDQEDFKSHRYLGRYLRQQVYFLEKPLTIQPLFRPPFKKRKSVSEPIATAIEPSLILAEIDELSREEHVLNFRNFDLYLVKAERIPYLIQEIGRLREITFRAVGEGSNKSRDLDEYDLYAHHLLLWDTQEQQLAGAYRLGFGHEIMQLQGSKGMYFTSLFKIGPAVESLLPYTIELGRAFVVEAYQNKPYPLFLLWKGLSVVMLTHPDYRYFMGCVSISNSYSKYSKSLLMAFIMEHYYNHELARDIKPRKRFRARIERPMKQAIASMSKKDVQAVDQFIEQMEPGGVKIPVLLKKYLKQNAKIIGFNVDPDFNDSLDGLMILDLFDLPLDTVEQAVDSISDPTILENFVNRTQKHTQK